VLLLGVPAQDLPGFDHQLQLVPHISLNLGAYLTSRLDGIDEGCRLGNDTCTGFTLRLLQNIVPLRYSSASNLPNDFTTPL
jgi:hypothetical protein